ncbi:MAG: glycosyltransferase family 2 protein [Planctomycetes bacterium]|nr:glycosyltransferase family 2 protein [Planctomycetota bacterium]
MDDYVIIMPRTQRYISKKVYIIILNWNGHEDTIECIDSCLNLNYSNFYVIVIDNHSTDDSVKIIRNKYPDIILLEFSKNLGYGKANNIAIRYAMKNKADYIWLLNNDIVVEENSLEQLVYSYENISGIGLMGTKILNYYDKNVIDYVGGNFNKTNGSTSHVGRNKHDLGQYDNQEIVTDFITGCSVFSSSDFLNRLGPIPEEYFLYYEDVDWSLRASKMGYIQYVNTKATVLHKCSSTSKRIKGIATFYITRNRLFLLEKYGYEKLSLFKKIIPDISKFLLFIKHYNFRGCFNILLGYIHWLFRLTGKKKKLGIIMKKL